MYSDRITELQISQYERNSHHTLTRYPISHVDELCASIASNYKKDGTLRRPFTSTESEFMRNELVLSKLDFKYWDERYSTLILDGSDGGGIGKPRPWASQRMALEKVGKIEEVMWEQYERQEPVDGILMFWHKARQLGATAFAQRLIAHRVFFTSHLRALIASADPDKTHKVFLRFERIMNNLPLWMKPAVRYQTKNEGVVFEGLDTIYSLQSGNQESGIGEGEAWDVSHFTEVADWNYPAVIEHYFFPTIPQSMRAMCILESTAQGNVGWWADKSELARKGKLPRWNYIFVPWYVEKSKYRRTPPVNWQPSEVAMLHAKMVYDTSVEFIGKQYYIPKDNLYWWETTRQEYQESGRLNIFFMNYPATPEESFQFSGVAAFSFETLERIRVRARVGVPYELHTS